MAAPAATAVVPVGVMIPGTASELQPAEMPPHRLVGTLSPIELYRREKERRSRESDTAEAMEAARREFAALLAADRPKGKGGRPAKNAAAPAVVVDSEADAEPTAEAFAVEDVTDEVEVEVEVEADVVEEIEVPAPTPAPAPRPAPRHAAASPVRRAPAAKPKKSPRPAARPATTGAARSAPRPPARNARKSASRTASSSRRRSTR